MEKQTDVQQPIELSNRLQERFAQGYTLDSISFDRVFYSLLAKKALSKDFNHLVMPKKGNKTVSEQESEADKTFVGLRKKHSAVESNINELKFCFRRKFVIWGVFVQALSRIQLETVH